jgi:hypothetical protein
MQVEAHTFPEETPMPSKTTAAPMVTPDVDADPAPLAEPLLPAVAHSQATTTPMSASVLEASLTEWGKQREVITRYIKQHFVDGTDFYTIKVGGRETKPTLGKPGAEKFLRLFQLQASFRKDEDTWEMLGKPAGVLCYVCTLVTRQGEVVGEGRGAREVKQDKGDINKCVKMCEKSAQIDAILRTGALSDAFTQDLEDDSERPGPTARAEIVQLMRQLGFAGQAREAYETWVQAHTGLLLVPENYPAIVAKLRSLLSAQAA